MTWIPGYERRYYNPLRFNVATAMLGTYSAFANAGTADRVGIEHSRRDDIPSPWSSIRPPVHAIPKIGTGSITTPPEGNLVIAKEMRKIAAEQAAARAAQEAGT
jgi:hypothetical protein